MSKMRKFAIGVIAVVIVVVAGAAGFIAGRSQTLRASTERTQVTTEVEVRLVDDDGDGIPDRGILDLPVRRAFKRDFGSDRGLGRGFDPGRGAARFPSSRFGPFLIIRGFVCLAVLAGVVVLGIALYRRWRPAPSSPPAPTTAGPTEPEAGETSPTEPESSPADSLEAEVGGLSGEASTPPEDDQPIL